jgi:uncharacterized protein YndB with AHSA1/START domain
MTASFQPAQLADYDLEISIDRPRDRVWKALVAETNTWWLPSFRMVGAASVVSFHAEAGGHLIEKLESGGSLLWYTVHMVQPGKSIHMVGQSFPEWGGPVTTMLSLAIEDRDGGCKLVVRDAHIGKTTDSHIGSLREGWAELFTKGLKQHCEAGA